MDMDNKVYGDAEENSKEMNSRSMLHMEEMTFQNDNSSIRRKCLICVAMVLFVIAVIFAILFVTFEVKYHHKYTDKEKVCSSKNCSRTQEVCLSENCVKTAAIFLRKIDKDADPCEDFSQFACGKFYRDTIIPDNQDYVDVFSKITHNNMQTLRLILQQKTGAQERAYVTKMKKFYGMCMDVDTIERVGLKPYLKSPDSREWPTLNPAWDPLTYDLNNLTSHYEVVLLQSLFGYKIGADMLNATKNVFTLRQPSLCLGLKRMKEARNDSAIMACQQYYVDVAVALGADHTTATEDAKAWVDFEIELAKISEKQEDAQNKSLHYNPTSLAEMSKDYPPIDWQRTIQAIFKKSGLSLDGNMTVIIEYPAYFTSLGALLNSTNKRVIQNRYGYLYAVKVVKDLTQGMRDASLQLLKYKKGVTEKEPRWRQCIQEVMDIFGAGLARLFVSNRFSEKSKAFIKNMMGYVKSSFQQQLQETMWMGLETKQTAILKLKALKNKIGYPDKNFSDEDIDKKYENMAVFEDKFCETRLDLSCKVSINELRKLTKDVDNSDWQTESMAVNAQNVFEANEIRFFAGFLQPTFFSEAYPSSISYGAIGNVLGHEITHFFDNKGRQYDQNGNVRNWWNSKDQNHFEEKIQCLIDQYAAFQVKEISASLNGKLTIAETTADNGGIKAAYRAYKNYSSSQAVELPLPGLGLSTDQQFFLSFAQTHCSVHTKEDLKYLVSSDEHPPGKYRILGTLRNNQDFARVFNCSIDSPMNPVKKCEVW